MKGFSKFINPFDAYGAADNATMGEMTKYLSKKEIPDTSVLTDLVIDEIRKCMGKEKLYTWCCSIKHLQKSRWYTDIRTKSSN